MATPDLTEFERLDQRDQRRPCKVGKALAALGPADRVKAEAALATSPDLIRSGAIEKWFRARGHAVPVTSFHYHRTGRCACPDE